MDLTAAEIVALATAIKDKQVTEAKKALPDGSAHSVDLTVRIQGSVQKGTSTPAGTVTIQPAVSLRSPSVMFALLRQLGIGAKRLLSALAVLPATDKLTGDAEFEQIVADEEAKRAQLLPPVTQATAGRNGTVNSQVAATKLLT